MNLDQVGKGKQALVFVYDPNLSVSIQQSEQMNAARDQLGGNTLFMVAKIGTPVGDQVMAKYAAKPAELLVFDPSGKLVKRQFALKQTQELIEWFKN